MILALGQVVVWAGLFYVFPAMLLRWEQSFGWSKASLTAAITIALLLSAITSPLVGRLIDRGLGPHVMTASAVIGGLALMCLGFVSSPWQFYVVWSIIGICLAGCLYEPCFALITRAYGEQAKRGIITVTLIAGFASTVSFSSAHLLSEMYDWRRALFIFGMGVICLGAPLLWVGASRVEAQGRAQTTSIESTPVSTRSLLTPVFYCLALGFALVGLVHGMTIHHLLSILVDRGLGESKAVLVASFIGPMQVAGRVVVSGVARRVSNFAVANCSFLSVALSIFALMQSSSLPMLVVVFVVLFGGGYGVVSIIRPVIARDVLGGDNFGAKSGLLASVYLLGAATAPHIGSIIWTVGGYDVVLMVSLVLILSGYLLFRLSHCVARPTAP
ncbi:hypothetical protein AB833_30335 [Chromatiales bacterium (ex Bugula neritina AB1)]|nr:hypothetical protein AB833_30335 [Chromatiales bacterium (ex Bugula neritina AB1)]